MSSTPTLPLSSMNQLMHETLTTTTPMALSSMPIIAESILPVLNVDDFNECVIRSYEEGGAENDLPADLAVARSLVPAGTATLRDFSYVAPEIPEYIAENCTGCMDCVTLCPDTAILGKVKSESEWETLLGRIPDASEREDFAGSGRKPRKYYDGPKKKLGEGGKFAIIIDPSKCKGCAECVTVCDDQALKMIPKDDDVMMEIRKSHRFFKQFGPSDDGTSTTTC
jgi:pyruvate ferredoxin oxidoreductase beta subunit